MQSIKRLISNSMALVLAVLMISAMLPMAKAQTMSISISPSTGPVGTKVTVTGTIATFNGDYEIRIDRNDDGDFVDTGELLASGKAVGYSVSKVVTIPDAYGGGRKIRLIDKSAAGEPCAEAFFTVETKFAVSVSPTVQYEGGPLTLTANVTGGLKTWAGILDLRFRVVDPTGATVITEPKVNLNEDEVGKFSSTHSITTGTSAVSTWGTYTVLLDWDDNEAFDEAARSGVASATFTIRLTDKAEYERTETIKARARTPTAHPTTADYKYQILDPTGAVVEESDTYDDYGDGAFLPEWSKGLAKDSPLGTYTMRVVRVDVTPIEVVKSQTFTIKAATLQISFVSADFMHDSDVIDTANEDVMRFETVTAKFYVKYPSGAYASALDIPAGFKVAVYYNTTKVADITLDPLLNFEVATNKWVVSWKVPKDAKLGINYAFNVTAFAVGDAYGNSGPSRFVSTSMSTAAGGTGYFFEVVRARLTVTTPSLVYPGAGASLERTLEARASIKVTYPDGSLFTPADLSWLNVSVVGPSPTPYRITLAAADYVAEVGLWIAKWKIPYNAPTGSYSFQVKADNVVDKFGNSGPTSDTPSSSSFSVAVARITITGLRTDSAVYETGETVYVTFDALYPSGEKVTKGTATITIEPTPPSSPPTITANYDAGLGKWLATFTVGEGWIGRYNVTIAVDKLEDDASPKNTGPKVKAWTGFSVAKVTIIEVVVDIGSSYFPGESATFFAIARLRGAPYDLPAAAFSATVYGPDGVTAPVTATKLATGLYKFTYTLPSTAPAGGYVAEVKVHYEVAPYTYARGFGIASFSVSPTLSRWDTLLSTINARVTAINGTVATISTTLGAVRTTVDAINARIIAINGTVATIRTDVGVIRTDVAAIRPVITAVNDRVVTISTTVGGISTTLDAVNARVTAISGDVATIETDVGTIKGKIVTVDGNVATIKTDVGAVKLDVSGVKADVSSLKADISDVQADVAAIPAAISAATLPIWIAVTLSLIAAIASIYAIVTIRRKIAG